MKVKAFIFKRKNMCHKSESLVNSVAEVVVDELSFVDDIVLTLEGKREVKTAIRKVLRRYLFDTSFYVMVAEELIDDKGFMKQDRPLYEWVKKHLFGGNVRHMMWYLHKHASHKG